MKTVREHYFITEEDMDNLERLFRTSGGGYWVDAYRFILSMIDADFDVLTEPQRAWLEDILERIQK